MNNMEQQKLKFIKGKCQQGCPADIYFYTDVDYWSVDDFMYEFNWLVEYVCPSSINIHINSVGGSVVDGMSVFSRIVDCPIPTACYNDGLAASMGSVIWAAGKDVYMKDYALLMIHNPFVDGNSGKEYNQVTEAFKQQLSVIYQKRFGLSEEDVEAIMNGEGNNDGTFFTAAQAVEKGFIAKDHIIETPEAQRGAVEAALKDGLDICKLKAVMNSFADLSQKPLASIEDNHKLNINNKMEKNETTVIAALFGLTGEKATVEAVSAQIAELKAKADKFDETKAALDKASKELGTAQTELQGAKASVKNLTEDLDKAKAELQQFHDAAKAEQEQRVDALVEKAIADCKIDKADKETWVKMAQNDFALAESVLAKIPARDNLGNAIAASAAEEAKNNTKTDTQKEEEKVFAVVGKDFKFKKLD